MPQPERDFEKEEKAIAGLRQIACSISPRLLLVLHDLAIEVSRLDYETAWSLLQIAKRIGKARDRADAIVSRVAARSSSGRGEVDCETADEFLDARIASVVALVLRGEVRGRKLAP